jgi:hypothetical protein
MTFFSSVVRDIEGNPIAAICPSVFEHLEMTSLSCPRAMEKKRG